MLKVFLLFSIIGPGLITANIDNDAGGFYGCWGAYPFTQNNYIYASDMQYGLFILEYNSIYAGWSNGYIYDEYGEILANLELRSLLNNKIFQTDESGHYDFGFSEGVQTFEFSVHAHRSQLENKHYNYHYA